MAARIRSRRARFTVFASVVFVGSLAMMTVAAIGASETPRRGGVLLAAIAADAPSLDAHQENTFATLQPVAPLYSTLLQIDPYSSTNVIGALARGWQIASDGLTS